MTRRIFLAGASGAIGRRLVPLLRQAGHEVVAMTRSPEKAAELAAWGAETVVLDVYDRERLRQAVAAARPEVVINQLTDLPPGLDPARMQDAIARNARIREEGAGNLSEAAAAAGARRLVAQSIAWAYAPGPEPHDEDDALDIAAEGARGVSVRGVAALERHTLSTPGLDGTVLRYAQLYGPGTGFDAATGDMPLHVDAAAYAALRAVETGQSGVFNIAEPTLRLSTTRAQRLLQWTPDYRLP